MDAAGNENSEKPLLEPLTQREQEILGLLAEGLTSTEMAERLTLAVGPVRLHIQQIFGKLGVNGKRAALTRAGELGLIPPVSSNTFSPTGSNLSAPRHQEPLPTGTVTFLFTDIEGSTPLWEQHPTEMTAALKVHNAALRGAVEANHGWVFKVVGDAFQAAFATPHQALKAAIEGQLTLQSASWNELGSLKVRMGLHTGIAELDPGGDEYAVSHTKNRVARIMSAAHGGQILLSAETAELVQRQLPPAVTLKDLGEHRLKGMALSEHLVQVCAPGLVQVFPALSSAATRPNNLPIQLTSFVGRDKEIEAVCELVRLHRLVTLTGSGGVGKTRLSIQVAAQMLAETPDGVWYVELAPISSQDLVPQIVAAAFGLREDPKRPLMDVLNQFLGNRVLLLVLDNCEHLLEACARLADVLLKNAPKLKIFVSSREALGIAGEYAYRVPSLTIPDPDKLPELADLQEYEAVRLFTERARMVLPTFAVDERNAEATARICQRLDGIPLALELAAARLNLLSPEQLAGRLDSAFRLLTGGSRTALPRQQTLRGTIDWSYTLLSVHEQILLRRLAVFSGGSVLEAIETVCSGEGLEAEQILDLLSGLVNKSMVNAEYMQSEETRYRLLETVRQYAREKLYEAKESQDFYDRHLVYYLDLAETIEPILRTKQALEKLHMLESEADNLRSALSWALGDTGGPNIEAGLRLSSALLNFWHTQNYQNEGYTWLKKGLFADSVSFPDSRVRAKACFAAGHLILAFGGTAEARRWIEESLGVYKEIDDTRGTVMAQSLLGEICAWSGFFNEARELGEASLTLSRTLDNPWLLAWVLCRYGTSLFFYLHDDKTVTQSLLEESLRIFEQLGDPLQVGDLFIMLGAITFQNGDFADARVYNRKALTVAQASQSKWTEANALLNMGYIDYIQGDFLEMQNKLIESVALKREMAHPHLLSSVYALGIAEINLNHPRPALQYFKEILRTTTDPEFIAYLLVGIARAAHQTNQDRTAALLLRAVKSQVDVGILQMDLLEKKEYERGWAEIKDRLGEPAFEKVISEGEELALREAVALALNLDL